MTIAIAESPLELTSRAQIELDHASWELYELLLRDMGEQNLRITYDRGRMVIMSPLPKHEVEKKLIGRMIEILSLELNIPIMSCGSTTFKREDLERGLEPDECYYIQHEPQMRNKDVIDLQQDPPPDLVVEVDITHHPIDRAAIYAALGVPEIWQFDGRGLQTLHLGKDGLYQLSTKSLAFAFLQPSQLERFLTLRRSHSARLQMMLAFRDWIREQNWK